MSYRQYDPDTGQVYTEYTVSGSRDGARNDAAWVFQGDEARHAPTRERGVSSLLDLALRSVASNIEYVTEEHFESLPFKLLARVWIELEKGSLSFHAWRLLSSQWLLKEDDQTAMGLYRFSQQINQPGLDLRCYTQPLTSPSMDFITHIMLTDTCRFRTTQLLCLAHVKNLGVLEIMHPVMSRGESDFPVISDRLIRGWTEIDDPFPVLRILKISGRSPISRDAIAMVSKFPSLSLFDVQGEWRSWAAASRWAHASGWSTAAVHPGEFGYGIRELLRLAKKETGASAVDGQTIDATSPTSMFRFHKTYKAPFARINLSLDGQAVPKPSVRWNCVYRNDDLDRFCEHPFGSLAFWTYAMIGQLKGDEDLDHAGVRLDRQASIGSVPLPCKPIASLCLGSLRTTREALSRDMGHWVFTRLRRNGVGKGGLRGDSQSLAAEPATTPKRTLDNESANANAGPRLVLKRTKQMDLGDLLRRF